MNVPIRIQRKRAKGWTMPLGAVYVGRPTIWGNPFTHPDPAQAVEAHPDTLHWAYAKFIRANIAKLRGKNLACWCPLDRPCHADVLLELVNVGVPS